MGKIIKVKIDFSRVSDYVDGARDDALKDALARRRLYDETDLYSLFEYPTANTRVRESGFTRDPEDGIVFALTRDRLNFREGGVNSFAKLFSKYDSPGIAVYDWNKMRQFKGYPVESNVRGHGEGLSYAVENLFGDPCASKFAYEFLDDPRKALKGIVEISL